MTPTEAFEILGIQDKSEKIWNSHSSGELFYINYYVYLAERVKDNPAKIKLFKDYFLSEEAHAIASWRRPESIYQHLAKGFVDVMFNSRRK